MPGSVKKGRRAQLCKDQKNHMTLAPLKMEILRPGPREEQQEIDVDRMRDDVKTEALAAGWFADDCTEIRDDGFECFT